MFKRWCIDQGFANNSNLSHVLMDGGVLSVPFDRLNDFYEKYVDAYTASEKVFIVEQKTENYNFFMDLDYKDEDELSFEQIESICKVICDKVSKFGGKDALVSVAEPKPIGNLIKTGIHINWSGFVVNRSSALALREHVINTLHLAYGSRSWENIIDISVYGSSSRNTNGSGFRMPWSHKRAKHELCSGLGCETCENTGKETQSEYLPIYIYKHGPLAMLQKTEQNPTVNMLHMATLRTENTEPVIVEGIFKKHDEGAFTDLQTKNVFENQEALLFVEEFVNKHVEGQGSANITKMYNYENQFLVSTTSKYCENLRRAHNSNHVWFHITGDIIRQKCFCDCETMKGRFHGFCKDFSGREYQLTKKITDILYEDGKVQKCVPRKKTTVESKPDNELLEKFIKKNVFITETFCIETLKSTGPKKYIVITKEMCLTCEQNISFKIIKNQIQQVCKCKCRAHNLTDKIVSTL